MPVKLRLRRQGRKNAAHYAIVAADSRYPRDGRFIEKIGAYDPIKQPAQLYINEEAAIKWLTNGAQPTLTVRNLLRHAGITLKYALIKQGKQQEEMARVFNKWVEAKNRSGKMPFQMIDRYGKLSRIALIPVEEKGPKILKEPPVADTPVDEAPSAE